MRPKTTPKRDIMLIDLIATILIFLMIGAGLNVLCHYLTKES